MARLRELKGNMEVHQPVHEGMQSSSRRPPRHRTGSLNEPLISSQSYYGVVLSNNR